MAGRPRSTIATSSGYSRPANRPSSPSRASSTVKPAASRRLLSDSRSTASSSTRRIRMASPPPRRSAHRATRGIDAHRPHLSRIVEEPQHVDRAGTVLLGLRLHHTRVILLLDALDGLLHGELGRRGALGQEDRKSTRLN